MPRFTQPLWSQLQRSDPNGPLRIVVRADLVIEVQNAAGDWVGMTCMVDTGAAFPTMATVLARSHGLAIPNATSTLIFETADGTTSAIVRDGELNVRFPQLPELIFSLKWLFRDDIPFDVQPLLGLHNTLDLFTLVFDGTPRPDGFMGCMEFITRDS